MAKRKKQKNLTESEYYVAERESDGLYIIGFTSQGLPIFGPEEDASGNKQTEWSEDESTVLGLINRLNLEGVKPKPKGGVRPTKPPLVP